MLRWSGNVLAPSLINVLMCVLDVIFNAWLIFPTRDVMLFGTMVSLPGMGLGVLGAVCGTSLSFIVCSLLMCYYACIRSKELDLRQEKGRFLPQLSTLRSSLKIGLPIGIEHIVFCGAQIASTIIVAPLGLIAIAAH